MAVGVASTGIHQTTDIKFSQLRREFKTISPRTTFSGSDDHSGDTGSISASELLRNTSLSVADPVVPDVDENANIVTTESNWNISGFKNAIKYYYLNQTDTDDNGGETSRPGFAVTDPTVNSTYSASDVKSWPDSISKNILKKAFIDGVVGSLVFDKESLSVGNDDMDINNLVVSIGGSVYGSAGYGDAVRYATLTLSGNYSFPIGAAVTQYTGFGTYVAVGIVSATTNNSNTVDIIQSSDLEFFTEYDGEQKSDATYFSYKKFRVINNNDNQLYVNDAATGLTISSKTEYTSTSATNGGNAISFNLTGSSSNNVKISVGSGATIYAGGGGGGKGGNGGRGGNSATQSHRCTPPLNPPLSYSLPFSNAQGTGGNSGGMGGMGRGYLNANLEGTENPILGEPGNGYNTKNTYTSGMGETNTSGSGGGGGNGGNGGQYGESGDTGDTGETGTLGGPAAIWCSPGSANAEPKQGQSGGPTAGSAGSVGASGGSSINGSGWDWAPEVNTDNVDISRQIRGSYTYGIPSP